MHLSSIPIIIWYQLSSFDHITSTLVTVPSRILYFHHFLLYVTQIHWPTRSKGDIRKYFALQTNLFRLYNFVWLFAHLISLDLYIHPNFPHFVSKWIVIKLEFDNSAWKQWPGAGKGHSKGNATYLGCDFLKIVSSDYCQWLYVVISVGDKICVDLGHVITYITKLLPTLTKYCNANQKWFLKHLFCLSIIRSYTKGPRDLFVLLFISNHLLP